MTEPRDTIPPHDPRRSARSDSEQHDDLADPDRDTGPDGDTGDDPNDDPNDLEADNAVEADSIETVDPENPPA
ncbi:hypothetical protein [Agromyces laixinhei]|uniref:hypothetical protein n=1 Tax=Agromyces laixinhei TaxID=2585717 RepID=UPI0012EE1F7F|nr:hypothetical protein [Agromyces laixinhei]